MATWTEIREHARANFNLREDNENGFSLVWKYEDGRTQLVFVRKFEAFDESFLRFRTAVCKDGEMSEKLALKKNAGFAIGALGLDGQALVLEYSMPLRGLDFSTFEIPLRVLPRCADELEKTYSADNDIF